MSESKQSAWYQVNAQDRVYRVSQSNGNTLLNDCSAGNRSHVGATSGTGSFCQTNLIGSSKLMTIKTEPMVLEDNSSSFKELNSPKSVKLMPADLKNFKFVQQSTPKPIVLNTNQMSTSRANPPSIGILSRRKQDSHIDDYFNETKKVKRSEKGGKGLRHFSMKVCEKVKKKGVTTYNEVADELVGEFTNINPAHSLTEQQYDQKNIRRRVYDALNVLMAMNIISKEKKEIKWIGLPTSSLQEFVVLEREKVKKMSSIREKRKQLHELILNQISFKGLVQRNQKTEAYRGRPPPNSYIQLPFLIISANKKTEIDCSISNDKMEYMFQFNEKFEINDDLEVLKSLGLLMDLDTGRVTTENLEKLKALVPKSLEAYVTAFNSFEDFKEIVEDDGGMNSLISSEDLVEATFDDNSRQSSSDPLSPSRDFSDEDGESDASSDIE